MKQGLLAAAALTALIAPLGAQTGPRELGSITIPQQVSTPEGTLQTGTYQLRLDPSPAQAPQPVGTSGRTEEVLPSPAGPWIAFVQNGEVKLRAMAVVPPSTMKIPNGIHAMRVRNDDDPYVRISVKQRGQTYLVYLPVGS